MAMLDDVLGGLGDDAAGGLGDLLRNQGGIGGLAQMFQGAGMGEVVQSWIGQDGNLSVSPEQIRQVLGSGPVADFAARLGVSPEQASETLAGLLPEAVDRMTPNGTAEGVNLDDLLGRLPGGVGGMLGGFLKR